MAGLVFDHAGNLYGATALGGGVGCGMIYELSPSGSGWREQTVHDFQCGSDGGYSASPLLLASSGDLYGASLGENGGNGTVFGLTPSGGGWLYALPFNLPTGGPDNSGLVMDAAGNLYGTATNANGGPGSVFELTPSDGAWIYTDLHDFNGGSIPTKILIDSHGDLFGAASPGGAHNEGIVWEITP